MTGRCHDLDAFFDGELPADQADAFRDHLIGCDRCQTALLGRMQEATAAGRRPTPARLVEPAPRAAASVVVAPARAPGCSRRLVVYAAPVLATAAAVTLWFGREREFELTSTIEQGDTVRSRSGDGSQTLVAHPGNVLRSTVRGERHQAILVYLDDRDLVVACTGAPSADARCTTTGDALVLELPLTARGHYAVIALGSAGVIPIPPPQNTLDEVLVATRSAGIEQHVERFDVD